MRTRKLLALLLVMIMSLTIGSMTALADEELPSGDPEIPASPAVSSELTDEDLDSDFFPQPDPEPEIKVTGAPTEPVKAGDTVSYLIETESEDFYNWNVILYDTLWDEVENLQGDREIELVEGKATVTYQIPKDHFFYEESYYVNVHTERKGDWGIMPDDYTFEIPAQRIVLEGKMDFQTSGLVTGKEYPFTVTWTNTSDITIEDFKVSFTVGGMYGPEESGIYPEFKVKEIPDGAEIKKGAYGGVTIEPISISPGSTIRISGTVLFPEKSNEGGLYCEEFIKGKWFGRVSKSGFSVTASAAGGETPGQQPGTNNNANVVKDNATGITVSGTEAGVELRVAPVSEEQKKDIEEEVKKLAGTVKGIKIFDISLLKDGKEIQPGTPVTVTLPIPDGFSKNVKLYHQNDQGELESVSFTVKGETVVFEAKSFSPYVLVDLGETAANATGVKAPRTGDTSAIMLYLVLALAAMGYAGATVRKRFC